MKICFIRHGQTEANVTYTYCGSTDMPLSEEGARLLAEKRKAGGYPDITGFDVYTSALVRPKQTLEILYGDMPSTQEPLFNEMDFGAFEGLGYNELKDREDYKAWQSGDHMANVCPGGESGDQVKERALKGVEMLLEKGKDALVVSHGGVIAILFIHYFPDSGLGWYDIQPSNGCGYVFEFEGGRAVSYTRIPLAANA